ncbi:hypothetical protein AB0D27_39865 [Streptomyces sp. NPDC048415]|uniref:hypothetical protein n=1 Tax=Streptomyces sp. NPDC048415 TaxID=3154822 RepID=UPI00343FA2BC
MEHARRLGAAQTKEQALKAALTGSGRDAGLPAAGEAGAMSELRVIVYPPSETGGRRVCIDDRILGTAYSLHDLTVFLQNAGLTGWDELDVAESSLIEWHEGGPEVWGR